MTHISNRKYNPDRDRLLIVFVWCVLDVFRMVELRMDRELVESRLRQQEDQLAQLQEELRRMPENSQSDTMQLVSMIVLSSINDL